MTLDVRSLCRRARLPSEITGRGNISVHGSEVFHHFIVCCRHEIVYESTNTLYKQRFAGIFNRRSVGVKLDRHLELALYVPMQIFARHLTVAFDDEAHLVHFVVRLQDHNRHTRTPRLRLRTKLGAQEWRRHSCGRPHVIAGLSRSSLRRKSEPETGRRMPEARYAISILNLSPRSPRAPYTGLLLCSCGIIINIRLNTRVSVWTRKR